jgi:cbb3-type cytochrome oxidase maturation protein
MTILIPMVVVGILMGGFGLYFAFNEGKSQQSKPQPKQAIRIDQPPITQEADALRAQQSSREGPQGPEVPTHGISLHP